MKSAIVTTRIDQELLAGLDRLAQHHDRSRAWLVAEAVRRYVADETALIEFLQVGEDDFARGDFITHEEYVAELRERRERRDAA